MDMLHNIHHIKNGSPVEQVKLDHACMHKHLTPLVFSSRTLAASEVANKVSESKEVH